MKSGLKLRAWQEQALPKWIAEGHRGIVEVVTGGGKTVFALACIAELKAEALVGFRGGGEFVTQPSRR